MKTELFDSQFSFLLTRHQKSKKLDRLLQKNLNWKEYQQLLFIMKLLHILAYFNELLTKY